jgi:hypothetical protein
VCVCSNWIVFFDAGYIYIYMNIYIYIYIYYICFLFGSRYRYQLHGALDPMTSWATCPHVSARSLAKLLKRKRGEINEEIAELTKIQTPYGPLVAILNLPLESGGHLTWPFINPFALLWVLCTGYEKFSRFLFKYVSGLAGIVMYHDETTPGNQMHHDKYAREVLCWYWSIAELPGWFRARRSGWLVLGYIQTRVLATVQGGVSGMTRHILHYMWNPSGFNFTLGIYLPVGDGRRRFSAKLLCFILDGLAEKKMVGVKGAGGLKCCTDCKNIMNTDLHKIHGDEWRKHYAKAMPREFDRHTDISFWEMADSLAEHAGTAALDDLEKEYGLNYEPHGLIYDIPLRQIFSPISNFYRDSMHTIIASGGVAGFEIAAFLLHGTKNEGLELETIDEWCAQIQWPSSLRGRLQKNFFATRVRFKKPTKDDARGSLKAFADECMQAVSALLLFWQFVLEPEGVMLAHGHCLRLLKWMLDLIFCGDEAVRHCEAFAKLVEEHFEQFIALYDITFAKPKLHWLFHIADALARFGVNLNCLKPERMHKLVRALGAHLSRGQIHQHAFMGILGRQLGDFFAGVDEPDTFSPYVLHAPLAVAPELLPAFAQLEPDVCLPVMVSKLMQTPMGMVKQGAQ